MQGLVQRAADRQEDLMISLNIEQLNAGLLDTGAPITPAYAPYTVIQKKKKGQPYDRVTLKDEGFFQGAIRVKQYATKYELISLDAKSEALQEKYGHEILGLSDPSLGQVRQAMKPLMIKDLRSIIKTGAL